MDDNEALQEKFVFTQDLVDSWKSGLPYERFMGRWSRPVAREFLNWLTIPSNLRWLDVGCGTGALSFLILESASPAQILAIDQADAFIAFAQQSLQDSRIRFQIGDALNLPADPNSFDIAVSGLVLNFIPNPIAAIAEMARLVYPGGTIAVYVWDYAGEMQMLRYFWDAAAALNPAAEELDEGLRFSLCQPEQLDKLFRDAGLHNVEVHAISIPCVFQDFDDYWSPFLGGTGPAPAYVKSLTTDERTALEQRLRNNLPISSDGSLTLKARAWAVRGTTR